MRQKSESDRAPGEQVVKDIRRATRRQHSRQMRRSVSVLEGVRGEESIAELCPRKGIASSLYYSWSKEFLDTGKRRLAGDMARGDVRRSRHSRGSRLWPRLLRARRRRQLAKWL